ncbi:2-dehydropantoate 2-reductase [Aliiglaciecola sp. LCG003]|uniref:2-dehydropantoate 2-reductase n=1 Tax=Aliiglaciecola sp. LCG003 TaxID=3053655 RepID=UPI0025729321|nr:2-dehydropantoate 2-reductase [Aliiglaciecola sp. LCG003]WJG07923.1 2-dehydropantoate 2-reductase [Aliiglaciecola sp. LCG003]
MNHNHLVFGAGLIGCYLGGAIALSGQSVRLLCRAKIQKNLQDGIKLTDYLGHQALINSIQFCQAIEQGATPFGIIWLTVKCTDVATACEQMQCFVDTHTRIICCQNGLGSEQIVKQAFPHNQVLRAMVPFNVVEMDKGHFHRGSAGTLTIESDNCEEQFVEQLIAQINSDLLPVESSADMDSLLWAKLQLNLGNSVNALADIPVKAMLEQRGYRLVVAGLMKELLAVTKAKNIVLPKVTAVPAQLIPYILRLPNILFKRVANQMLAIDPNVKTSMWWDLSRGKATEIDHLNGAVVQAGDRLNISCPANQKIISLIKSIQHGEVNAPKRPISAEQLYQLVFSEQN